MTRYVAFPSAFIFACVAMVLCGCEEKQITVQLVPAEYSSYPEFRKPAGSTASPSQTTQNRMVVAWFDRPDATWFFKVNGPKPVVDGKIDQIKEFFGKVKFDGPEPTWKLPEQWTEGPKKPMRFATLQLDGDEKLEVAVSQLSPSQDRLLNVNRWLGQLNVPEVSKEDVDEVLQQVDDADYLLFDALGQGSGQMGGGSNAPFANAPFLKRVNEQATRNGPSDIEYDLPEGWSAKRVTGMVPGVKFTQDQADPPVTITATRMPAAINKWIPNVERWTGQVGISLSADEIKQATETIKIGEIESQLIKLTGEENEMLGTLSVYKGDAWFFKLFANKDVVSKQEKTFREILKSIRFK